ncbi:hypothetical protein [Paenibacillus monticola]|uniref:Uncharacterized protein n=1 Tax=Paenibacillus monticola TaxID=2666075 RepID=A0A7X2H2U0_9BACL|nr:hypothetical protein [Paenibacillus monticola]MRN52544.1 hypothetical protein [Paenibacillus monticola]
MGTKVKWGAVCALLFLLLWITGCVMVKQAPSVIEMQQMSSLDGGLQSPYGPQAPVMQDVYSRSIPDNVYSAE